MDRGGREGGLIGGANSERSQKSIGGNDRDTRLVATANGLRLRGQKFYSTGAQFSDHLRITAQGDDGAPTAVVIPVDRAGVEHVDDWDGIGQRQTGSGTTVFHYVEVAADEVFPLGATIGLDRARGALMQLYLHAVAAGILRALTADAAALVRERRRTYTFASVDQPTADPQLLQVVGEIDAVAYTAQALVRSAAAELAPALDAARTTGIDPELPNWRSGPRSRPPASRSRSRSPRCGRPRASSTSAARRRYRRPRGWTGTGATCGRCSRTIRPCTRRGCSATSPSTAPNCRKAASSDAHGTMAPVLRWITAGESHGRALVAVVEGMVAGVEVTSAEIAEQLARRRLGYGRGARMQFERDAVTVLAGVRHGVTLGGPIAIEIGNTEWPKWETVMAADPVDPAGAADLESSARNAPLTRPRPGHADYAGMLKYGFVDARPVLERASARETAARVAAGTVARSFLRQALGVEVLSHVIAIGPSRPYDGPPPGPGDLAAIDASPVRAFDKDAEQAMIAEIEAAKKDGDTLGGVLEVVALGLPVGLGSFTSGDNRLDSQLAAAVMGIQAIKGVEIGDGFATARRRGSQAHDEMYPGPDGVIRSTNRAGGLEGGMTNGQALRVRAAMKPISTVPRALATVDMATGDEAVAIHQRSDVCAVPAAGVVVETMVALVLARAALDKFGGDSLAETRRNIEAYRRAVAEYETPAARAKASG